MENKKKTLAIVSFAVIAFVFAAFFALYKPVVEKIAQNGSRTMEEITGDLPELVCNYSSDQEVYRDAVISGKVGQCDCIQDSELKEVCKGASMDVMFYDRALAHLDVELCERINAVRQKDACEKVVANLVAQLEEKDPEYLASMYVATHNEKAIDQLEELTQRDQENVENYIYLALAYAEKGLREQEQGRDQSPYVSKALETIEKAKEIDDKNSEAYRAEAYINEIKPDFEKALGLYTEAIERDQNNILAYAGRGHVHRMRGILENAISDFEKAAALDAENQNIFIYTNLCNLEYSRNNNESAIKNCKIVVSQENVDPVFQSNAYQILATIYMKNADYVQAHSSLLTAKTLTPNDPNLYVTLSKLTLFEGDYVDAEAQARRAIELASTKSTAFLALSNALYMQERFDEAIVAAELGIQLVSDDVSLLAPSKPATERDLTYIIAHSYRHLGDSAKQTEYEQKAENVLKNNNIVN